MKKNNSGFSLVELIIVIAIMAVLIGVLAPQFIKNVEKSRESTDITNLDTCVSAVQVYYADHPFPASDIVISVSSSKFVANDGGAGVDSPALKDAGCLNSAVKSSKWTDLKATISADGKVKYEGTADYYEPETGNTGYKARD